eukprot:12907603-Ditylum_brightwellii.AAC.1
MLQTILLPVYRQHNIDPILRLLTNTFLTNPSTPLNSITQQHQTINFQPYKVLIEQQIDTGWQQLCYG